MPLERYVTAALAGESSVFRSDEALKAMAVAARTYAVKMRGRHRAEGFDFCDTTHCQRLELNAASARLESAVEQDRRRVALVPGQARFHALHARLRWPHRGCRCGLARPGGAISEDARRPILRAGREVRLAMEWRPARDRERAPTLGPARAGQAGANFDSRSHALGSRRHAALARGQASRSGSAPDRFASPSDASSAGTRSAATTTRFAPRMAAWSSKAPVPGTVSVCARTAPIRWGSPADLIARFSPSTIRER